MIASTMPLLTIHHKTEYRYAHPVAFGEHRIMLRPRDGHDLRVLSGSLKIVPEPMRLRWIHDVFGNSVAIATFDERAETLSFVSTATVEHNPAEEFALTPDDPAYFYPFLYDDEEFPDLVQFITPQYSDPNGELSAWARNFLDAEGPTPTFNILSSMTHGIREMFIYRKRHEQGTQHPLDTLQTRSGTCRDYALFMIEALRRLGIAARFVSGYLAIPSDRAHRYAGGGSTHAWVQVYLPSAGWIEFDPTNDIVGNETIVAEPNVPIGFYRDSFGNVCGRLVAPAGGVTLRGSALVRDSGLPDVVVPTAQQLPIDQLPDDLLFYLMASRYCETDKLTDIAWSLFGNTQPGWARVAAICTYVHNHVTFGYEHANYMKSAHDVYEQGAGVCRDFAHLALTFCRCMGIPARYCTGYMGDIGIPPDPAPMDFSGWFEVYLSGQWYTCDARHNHPRIGRILMGTGRDAADVALTTSFGRMDLVKFVVISDEVVAA